MNGALSFVNSRFFRWFFIVAIATTASSAPDNSSSSLTMTSIPTSLKLTQTSNGQPIVINIFRLMTISLMEPGMLVALERIRMNQTLSQLFDFQVTTKNVTVNLFPFFNHLFSSSDVKKCLSFVFPCKRKSILYAYPFQSSVTMSMVWA